MFRLEPKRLREHAQRDVYCHNGLALCSPTRTGRSSVATSQGQGQGVALAWHACVIPRPQRPQSLELRSKCILALRQKSVHKQRWTPAPHYPSRNLARGPPSARFKTEPDGRTDLHLRCVRCSSHAEVWGGRVMLWAPCPEGRSGNRDGRLWRRFGRGSVHFHGSARSHAGGVAPCEFTNMRTRRWLWDAWACG